MATYYLDQFSGQFGVHQDVLADLDFDNLPDPETMLRYYHILTCYGIGSQVLLPGQCNLKNTNRAFHEGWSKLFISSTCSPHASDSKRKRSDLFDTNISKDGTKLGSKLKLKIICSGKPLEPFVMPMEDGSSRVKIPRIDVVIPATPIPIIPIESILLRSTLDDSKGVCSLDNDEVKSARTANAPSLDLEQSYSDRTSAEVHGSYRMEVQGKLDEASHRLNREGSHYEAKMAELKQVELRHEDLLKELQHLEDQNKDLSCQVEASEHLLQEAEREVVNLQGQIDILNATEVMYAAIKASLKQAEAYIKESFEDLKNFQWNP
ncbi:hypothetical protein Cgig2_001011 [Carnegiea gigantea]|uniref:Uncharacterized protein n=1 Tax=Carnegiea gigantea TaxID=171969 RepID=A0A9Q1JT92_9CARY|nr:hypothetical protein Cgig2_001011 [Carnegiea gigantea]